ncbi:MAG: hypothetical protein AAB222_05040 [Candidatus Binatota bacterium]
MGKVFLIEPLKVLRQAITLSLFPEHDVMGVGDIGASEVAGFKDYDLLIVDAAALRERDQLTPEIVRAIQGLLCCVYKDVDARHKAGHDGGENDASREFF